MTEKKDQTETKSTDNTKSDQEIDRIRDIVFGSQMRQYEAMIATLQQDVEKLELEVTTLNGQLAEQDARQTKVAQTLRQELRDGDKSIQKDLRQLTQQLEQDKVGRAFLGELFVELGSQIRSGGSLADLLKGLLETE